LFAPDDSTVASTPPTANPAANKDSNLASFGTQSE
jgi:hypothetical protein